MTMAQVPQLMVPGSDVETQRGKPWQAPAKASVGPDAVPVQKAVGVVMVMVTLQVPVPPSVTEWPLSRRSSEG